MTPDTKTSVVTADGIEDDAEGVRGRLHALRLTSA